MSENRSVSAAAFSKELSELNAAATPGPWVVDTQEDVTSILAADGDHLAWIYGHVLRGEVGDNADLVAFLRNHAAAIGAFVQAAVVMRRNLPSVLTTAPYGLQAVQDFDAALKALNRV